MKDTKTINENIRIFDSSQVKTMDLEYDGLKIRLEKDKNTSIKQIYTEEQQTEQEDPVLKAPLAGVFHFSQEQTSYAKGEVVYHIESMKTMNEVRAPFDLVIKEFLVEEVGLVEFNQPLIRYEAIV